MTDPTKIMVIDDDADFLSYIQIVLSANGYRVSTAMTANEGLEAMRRDPPALVIVDVMMSYVLDGMTVRREMASDPVLSKIPVLMVSAIVADDEDHLFAYPQGAAAMERGARDSFMSKPVEPGALLARIAELTRTTEGRPTQS